MGEVFKARDTRLDRVVAIKILPPRLAADPEARARLQREAKAIAALNHRHICTLYDVGESGGTDYLVMELVQGETLAQRLERGALPVDHALKVMMELADALDKAHRAGIVHRDLKPGNIMLTKGGAKLLDFGVAKLRPSGPLSLSTMGHLATTSDGTASGIIVGTVPYMAPEQVEGKDADARTDLWALGVVFYEMVTATAPFKGQTPASVIGAILRDDPVPLSQSTAAVSPLIDQVIARCLEKDPVDRWQSAADVHHALAITMHAAADGAPTSDARNASRRYKGLWAAVAMLALAIAILTPGWMAHIQEPAAGVARLSLELPPNLTLSAPPASLVAPQLAISPNGHSVAFIAETPGSRPGLWVRRFDSTEAQLLAGTEDASYPFWSPDSQALGFFAHGKLKTIKLAGGPPVILSDSSLDSRGGTWGTDDVILFAPAPNGVLYRIPAAGGQPIAVTSFDSGRAENSHRFPSFLPDGRRFVYTTRSSDTRNWGIALGSLDGSSGRLITTDTQHGAQFVAPRQLLYLRGQTLVAQRFDVANGRLTGNATVLAENVGSTATSYSAFSASATGHVVYASRLDLTGELKWFDRSGVMLGTLVGPAEYLDFELSPDESAVAFSQVDEDTGNSDVWTIDLARRVRTRLTTDVTNDASAVWSPDGREIVFRSNRLGRSDAFKKRASGSSAEERWFGEGSNLIVTDWSIDGRYVLYATGSTSGFELRAWPTNSGGQPIVAGRSRLNAIQGRLSPDGKWLAYASDESGRWQVYVQPFPPTGDTKTISADGGSEPRWRRDGRELFFLAADMRLMSVELSGGALSAGAPKPLFETRAPLSGNPYRVNYAVSRDGRRFLVNAKVGERTRATLRVLQNWQALLEP